MGAAYTELMAGQVHIAFGVAPGVMPHVKSGRLRGLAVTSGQPSVLAPGLVPVAVSGLPGYDFTSPFGMFAPAGTPKPIVGRLNEAIVRVLNRPEMKERMFNAGMEVVGSTPEQLETMVRADMALLGKFMKDVHRKEQP
jgi:tripartite-type tricarboxylate transporter receptor subunit TctC